MIISNEIFLELNDYYNNLQEKAFDKSTIYSNDLSENEEYIFLNNALGKANLNLAKAMYCNNKTSAEKAKKEIEIINKKISIFFDNNAKYKYYFNTEYKCSLCKDSGYINGKPCKCFYENLNNLALEKLGISKKQFKNFSYDTMSEKCNLEKHYNLAKKYVKAFPDSSIKNFIFQGKSGCGKTYLTECIAGELLSKNYNVIFIRATELNNAFIKIHSAPLNEKTVYNEILKTCDLLIIDDLGTEPIYKNVTLEYLLSLISDRLFDKKSFIITTNLTNAEIENRYSERFLSRLLDKSLTRTITFETTDLRRYK